MKDKIKTEDFIKKLKKDDYSAIDLKEKIMLKYAIKLTKEPTKAALSDLVIKLKEYFSDRAIHDICTIASYFNFVNRVAVCLGIELENRFIKKED